LWELYIGIMIFILYKLYIIAHYTNPIKKKNKKNNCFICIPDLNLQKEILSGFGFGHFWVQMFPQNIVK